MNDTDDILTKIARALEGIDILGAELKMREYDEFAGVKGGRVHVDWTEKEGRIRSLSNSVDRMDKRAVVEFRVRAWTSPEFVAGRRDKEDRP